MAGGYLASGFGRVDSRFLLYYRVPKSAIIKGVWFGILATPSIRFYGSGRS
jgi:hypothetical protein